MLGLEIYYLFFSLSMQSIAAYKLHFQVVCIDTFSFQNFYCYDLNHTMP